MLLKKRLLFWSKLAQQTTTTPQAVPATTVAPPPAFQASGIWGWITSSYNSYSVTILNNLVSLLNTSLHYSSNGQYNWQKAYNNAFQIDPSAAPSVDTKNLLNLSLLVYRTFINKGNQFPTKPTPQQIQSWGNLVSNSQAFLNLSQINPTGPLAQKVQGNLKDDILNFIRFLNMYNPVQQR